jgi:predicted nucleotidyltransferase component of viral defense system
MIREADVRRFAGESRVDVSIARLEIILTIMLQRVATAPVGKQMVFKGGTALRKLVFGAAGRFSEDLDFAALAADTEAAQLELMATLEDGGQDGVSAKFDKWDVAGPGTLQALCSFDSSIGAGHFELDVTVGQRPTLVGAIWQTPARQSYFDRLGFDPAPILSMQSAEIGAEKLAAIHRRSANRNPKDIWDLWKWLMRPPRDQEIAAFRQLWPVRLWFDKQPWRGRGWFGNLEAGAFDWDRLSGLLPRGRALEPAQILQDLKARLAPWIDEAEGLLQEAGAGRRRGAGEVEAEIQTAAGHLERS